MNRVEIDKILNYWDIGNVLTYHKLSARGMRMVFHVITDQGDYILKGLPDSTKEYIVQGNVEAHIFLGNKHGLAPRLYETHAGYYYIKEFYYYLYVMDYIPGRELQETIEDEYKLGLAARKMHLLEGYERKCHFDIRQEISEVRARFNEYNFHKKYQEIIDNLPDFYQYQQCFIHTDITPSNARITEDGEVYFIDLDDSGLGPIYVDLGWPFIMQFVDFNKQTHEMKYRFDLAKAFLEGYCGSETISVDEYNLIWAGATWQHIYAMTWYGPDAVQSLWSILEFGLKQKAVLRGMVECIK